MATWAWGERVSWWLDAALLFRPRMARPVTRSWPAHGHPSLRLSDAPGWHPIPLFLDGDRAESGRTCHPSLSNRRERESSAAPVERFLLYRGVDVHTPHSLHISPFDSAPRRAAHGFIFGIPAIFISSVSTLILPPSISSRMDPRNIAAGIYEDRDRRPYRLGRLFVILGVITRL